MEAQVRFELKELAKGDKTKLSQLYSDEMSEILKSYGGNISDIPVNDSEHPYFKIQAKLQILSRI